jgi:hypothetical protein
MYTNFTLQMNLFETLNRLDSSGRAQLIARAPQFIPDANFLNLLNLIDVNNKASFARPCAMLRSFESIPDMRAKIAAWLRS